MKSNLICLIFVITICVSVTYGRMLKSDLKHMQNTYKNIDNRKTIISSPSNFATRNGSSDPELNKRVAQLTR